MLKSLMSRVHTRTVGFVVSLGLMALGSATQAGAACMDVKGLMSHMQGMLPPGQFVPALYRPGAPGNGSLLQVNDEPGIVGLWQFQMTGFSVDWGTQAWHSDGTEIMFSGAQNPETGDICQGVWRKVGSDTYTLNHIAMGWLSPGGGFGVRIHFHMTVKLNAAGTSFWGKYRAAVYSVSPQNPFDESVEVAHGTGNVTARRVRPD